MSAECDFPFLQIVREALPEKDQLQEHLNIDSSLFGDSPIPPTKTEDILTKVKNSPEAIFERIHTQLLTRMGENYKMALTCGGRADGVGAQALGKITTKVTAMALGQEYAHYPLDHLEHCDNHMKYKEYRDEWENSLQIAGGAPPVNRYPHIENFTKHNIVNCLLSSNFARGYLYTFRDAHSFTDKFREQPRVIEAWKTVLEGLRDRFYFKVTPPERKTLGKRIVAVHIRRGDIKDPKRWLDFEYYVEKMHHVLKQSPSDTVFQIVSEGEQNEFKLFNDTFPGKIEWLLSPPSTNLRSNNMKKNLNVRSQPIVGAGISRNQHLLSRRQPITNSYVRPTSGFKKQKKEHIISAFEAFKALVFADVLIMSKSSFSYLAALYSKGVKHTPPEMWWTVPKWCEDNDNWII